MQIYTLATVIGALSGASAAAVSARGECRTLQVQAGDSCSSLASSCGISGDDFIAYNGAGICSKLQIGQYVCCSSGSLPDTKPKPNPDGSCATVTVQAGDSCYALANRFGISVADIEAFNKDTPDWEGCARLLVGEVICVSGGSHP